MKKVTITLFVILGLGHAFAGSLFAQSDAGLGAFGIKKLAFVTGPGSFFSPHEDIWILDTLKSKPRRLAEGATAVWSPDGRKIAYCAHEGWGTDRVVFGQMQLVNADGTGHKQLTNLPGGACPIDWSLDGRMLAFAGPYQGFLLFANDDDAQSPTVLRGVPGKWSPDGSKLAFSKYRESAKLSGSIWVANGDGSNPKKVIDDNSEMIWLSWSPGGESIVFSSHRENKKQSEIFRVKVDGTGLEKIATDKKLSLVNPSISPNGKYLVVSAYGSTDDASILLMDLSNQSRKVLAHGIHAEATILWTR